VSDVLTWWAPKTGDTYADVDVVVYDRADNPECKHKEGIAAACTYTDGSATIAVERDTMIPLTDTGNPKVDNLTLAIFMAHESGHIITNRAGGGVPKFEGIGERRAECAAGIYITQEGGKYGDDAALTEAYTRRLSVFDKFVTREEDRAAMKQAFITGSDFTTADQCVAAFPE